LDIVTITGIAASTFTSLTLLPQLVKIIRERNADGTSNLMLFVLFIGLSLWIVYGTMKKDLIIIIANAVALFINILTGIFSFIHGHVASRDEGK
jgi:MtN3 and saliva related transmembrane protein